MPSIVAIVSYRRRPNDSKKMCFVASTSIERSSFVVLPSVLHSITGNIVYLYSQSIVLLQIEIYLQSLNDEIEGNNKNSTEKTSNTHQFLVVTVADLR